MDQRVTMRIDGLAGGGGGQTLTFPFSPGDLTGRVTMEGSKNSLGRFLTQAGVSMEIATQISGLSVQLLVSVDA